MATGNFNSGGGQWIPPIGFVWLSTENISPAIYFENTTWELISQNRVLMGAGDGHNGGDIGGSETHSHTLSTTANKAYAQIGNNGTTIMFEGSDGVRLYENRKNDTWAWTHNQDATSNNTENFSVPVRGDTDLASSLPPAYYVYMWRRAS